MENPLIGTWELVSYEAYGPSGMLYPLGKDATGYIMYTSDGYMSVTMMASGRRSFAGDDMLTGTDAEKIDAAGTYISYCGRYDYRRDRVVHKVEAAFFPNRVGTEQIRYIELDGDILILRTPPMVLGGESRRGQIVWRRAEPVE